MWQNGDKMEDLAKFGYKPDMTYEFFFLINLLLYFIYSLQTENQSYNKSRIF
jgi:hypothetical protein